MSKLAKKWFFAFIVMLLVLWNVRFGQAQEAAGGRIVAIQDVRIFDGDRVIPRGTVLVKDGVIAAVGEDVAVPPGAVIIAGRGRTLLPGLIDSHVHVFSEEALRQSLVFGVTSVIDMFTEVKFMAAVKEKQKTGQANDLAYLVSAGTLATAPGGHGTEYGLPIPTLSAPEQAQPFVDARIAEGADFIKIILDDGSSYGLAMPTLKLPEVAALIAAAHRRGSVAVVHAGTLGNCRDALQAGADGLAHLYFDRARDPGFGRLAARRGAFVIPTLSVIEAMASRSEPDVTVDPQLIPFLKPGDLRGLAARFPFKSQPVPWKLREAVIRQLRAAQVPILAGTDAPNPGTAFGASLHHELALLVRAGLTPLEALRAATSLAAEKFRLAGRGRIAPGFQADLLLVVGNPLADITATRDIATVWHNGVAVDREKYRQAVQAENEKVAQLRSAPPPPGSESGWISDFEGDKIASNFGAGWLVSSDSFRGGKSQAAFERVLGGANGSGGAMRITGTISDAGGITWAGAMFCPGPTFMAPANLSSWPGFRFWAKGDGRTYAVMIFSQGLGFTPAVRTFKPGTEWQEQTFQFKDFNVEGFDVMGIFIGASGGKGDFTLLIDDVRLK